MLPMFPLFASQAQWHGSSTSVSAAVGVVEVLAPARVRSCMCVAPAGVTDAASLVASTSCCECGMASGEGSSGPWPATSYLLSSRLFEPCAIIKICMWDDPAVAKAGMIFQDFEQQATLHQYRTGFIAHFLTWRLCYLLCGIVATITKLVLTFKTFDQPMQRFNSFLEQFSQAVDATTLATVTTALAICEVGVWALEAITLFGTLWAAALATPATAMTNTRRSVFMLRASWLVGFGSPFIVFLLFPMRILVDWSTMTNMACGMAVRHTFDIPSSIMVLRIHEMRLDPLAFPQRLKGLPDDVDAWCSKEGEAWHEMFYSFFLDCIWSVEADCRTKVCDTSFVGNESWDEMRPCWTDCLKYVQPRAVPWNASNRTLPVMSPRERSAPAVDRDSYLNDLVTCINSEEANPSQGLDVFVDLSSASAPELWAYASRLQRLLAVDAAELAFKGSLHTEYVVGCLIASVVGIYLVTAAVCVLGGYGEALINVKAVFPGSQAPGWVFILTTLESLPLYCACLGMFNQVVGDPYLSLACLFAMMLLALAAKTGQRILHLQAGSGERTKLYGRIWVEYATRATLIALIIAMLWLWSDYNGQFGLQQFVEKQLLTRETLVPVVVGFYSRKIIAAVVGTDVCLGAFVQSELWQRPLPCLRELPPTTRHIASALPRSAAS